MAWRIHGNVVRGEIDNRQRGLVRGKIWLQGVAEPVQIELKGNAAPDLAGCVLRFENLGETYPLRADRGLAPVQRGTIGDLTASRKVRALGRPFEEASARLKKKLRAPERMSNSLYLEWFSEADGRVVVESSDYKLTISPPAWRLTPEEEEQRQSEAAQGFAGFMQKVSEAVAAQKHQPPPEDEEWDEFDYEKFMRENDARTSKYGELLDKYMDHPDRDRIIAKEMGWTWLEEALGASPERAAEAQKDKVESDANTDEPFEWDDDLSPLEANPATEGVDWVRSADGHIGHPLSLRALEGSLALWHKCEELGLSKLEDDDLDELLSQYQTTSAKLAGALDGLAYGRNLSEGAFIVAYLKRALGYLHAAHAALEKVAPKNLLPAETVASTRAELFSVREEILRLMQEFRGGAGAGG